MNNERILRYNPFPKFDVRQRSIFPGNLECSEIKFHFMRHFRGFP